MSINKLTLDDIKAVIKSAQYYTFPGTTVTVCCLTLENGYNTTGTSACIDPANFDQDIGNKIAHENAVNEIWALEGYLAKEMLLGLVKGAV